MRSIYTRREGMFVLSLNRFERGMEGYGRGRIEETKMLGPEQDDPPVVDG